MKITLPLFAYVLFFAACKKDKPLPPVEKPVQKSVEYHVFAGNDYSAEIYRNVKVDLKLQILKTNLATGQQTPLWDSTFSTRKLTDFPKADQSIVLKKSFPILEQAEKLTGAFSIKYDTDGQIQQEAYFDEAGRDKSTIIIFTRL